MGVPYMPQQSPIDLGRAKKIAAVFPRNYLDLRWDGPLDGQPEGAPGKVEFTFQSLAPTVGLSLDGKFFHLLRYHFHTPSEHKVHDREWPLEVHVVHQNPQDKLYAVLAIMVEAGNGRPESNRFFKDLTQRLNEFPKAAANQIRHDPRDLLPVDRGDFYRYEGSLTTKLDDDNEETVSWVVYRSALMVDHELLQEFIKYAHPAKALQNPTRRFVLCNFISTG